MGGSGSHLLDPGLIKGVESLVQRESGSASFGTKVVPSLQRADPTFMNSVTGSVCIAKCSNILQWSFPRDILGMYYYGGLFLEWKTH
jgi:hypothetical protein